jgi:hypothetical protein
MTPPPTDRVKDNQAQRFTSVPRMCFHGMFIENQHLYICVEYLETVPSRPLHLCRIP